MRNYPFILATLASTLVLAACGGEKAADEAKTDAAAATTAEADKAAEPAATAAAAPAAGAAPTKDFVVGKWGEPGQCAMAIEFKADGSMVGPADKWELKGNELTFVGMPQKMVLKVIDDKTMESSLDGTAAPRKLTRC